MLPCRLVKLSTPNSPVVLRIQPLLDWAIAQPLGCLTGSERSTRTQASRLKLRKKDLERYFSKPSVTIFVIPKLRRIWVQGQPGLYIKTLSPPKKNSIIKSHPFPDFLCGIWSRNCWLMHSCEGGSWQRVQNYLGSNNNASDMSKARNQSSWVMTLACMLSKGTRSQKKKKWKLPGFRQLFSPGKFHHENVKGKQNRKQSREILRPFHYY